MTATRINIEEELENIHLGQCVCCRIHATHNFSPSCPQTPEFVNMTKRDCGHVFYLSWFSACPICNNPQKVRQ